MSGLAVRQIPWPCPQPLSCFVERFGIDARSVVRIIVCEFVVVVVDHVGVLEFALMDDLSMAGHEPEQVRLVCVSAGTLYLSVGHLQLNPFSRVRGIGFATSRDHSSRLVRV